MLKSVMNDDEQAFSSIMELIFEKLYSLHVLSHAEHLCVNGRGGYPRSWVWYILRNVFTCPHMFLTSKHTRKPILNAIHPVCTWFDQCCIHWTSLAIMLRELTIYHEFLRSIPRSYQFYSACCSSVNILRPRLRVSAPV